MSNKVIQCHKVDLLHAAASTIAIWKNLMEWDYPKVDLALKKQLQKSIRRYNFLYVHHQQKNL